MINLENKTILVTGATGGIGKEIVSTCLSLGAKVIAVGRNIQKLDDLNQNNNLVIIKCDFTVSEDVDNLLSQIECLNGIVHCAGRIYPYPIKFIKEKYRIAIK